MGMTGGTRVTWGVELDGYQDGLTFRFQRYSAIRLLDCRLCAGVSICSSRSAFPADSRRSGMTGVAHSGSGSVE